MEIIATIIEAVKNTSIIEWLIFATAIIYVLLAAAENIGCWLFGILSSALSVYLCYTGKLFLESILSFFYVLIAVYGWYQWKFGSGEKTAIKITSAGIKKNSLFILSGILIWLPIAIFAENFSSQALPYLDAFVTAFSIIATYMTAKKIIENWIYWIVIDAAAIYLYASRQFYLIALLYFIYTLLSFAGYIKWKTKPTT
jgi:nicotinamide mononucleotide transporter